jgi:hypothetical protein
MEIQSNLDGMRISAVVPDGTTLGEVVGGFIKVGFAACAGLCDDGRVRGELPEAEPALALRRAEGVLLDVWETLSRRLGGEASGDDLTLVRCVLMAAYAVGSDRQEEYLFIKGTSSRKQRPPAARRCSWPGPAAAA